MAETKTSIQNLPVELLIYILTFLPTIDAIRSTLISPKFLNLWHQIPSLNFDLKTYHSSSPNQLSQSRIFFTDFISQTLIRRPHTFPIHTFRLHFSYLNYPRSQSQVDSWLRYAIASGATDLRLSFNDEGLRKPAELRFNYLVEIHKICRNYEFHFSDLIINNCCSVKVLELFNCNIVWPNSVSPTFSSITWISLHYVGLASNEDLYALVSSCVNLEYLCLYNVGGFHGFKIYSKSLKELKLVFKESNDICQGGLEICAPNLRAIDFDCCVMSDYCFKDLSSLVEARVNFLERCSFDFHYWCDLMRFLSSSGGGGGIERLNVQNMRVNWNILLEEVFTRKGNSASPPFKNLKHLELRTGYSEDDLVGIAGFLHICPDLETLVLDYVYKTDYSLADEFEEDYPFIVCNISAEDFKSDPLILHIPCLKQVKMKSYNETENELYMVELLKMHQVVLQKIVAFPEEVDGILLPPVILFDNVTSL